MPVFDFECPGCEKVLEVSLSVGDCDAPVYCATCGSQMKKVFISGHGGIQCDSIIDVPWLASAIQSLQPDHERPITTRGEYQSYLKERDIIASG